MSTSKKIVVIEWLFAAKYDARTGEIPDAIVTFEDVRQAIRATGVALSPNNPANFWKDLTRSKNRNSNWPAKVLAAGYSGADAIGESKHACFKFVRVPPEQSEAFFETISFDRDRTDLYKIQSISMPQATKALGRTDENWLAQVSSRLSVVETFFALCSGRAVREVSFLQTGVKLKRGEVDAAYLVTCDDGRWLVSAEVKGRGEPLHGPQIARAAFALQEDARKKIELSDIRGVIPLGIKAVDVSTIWVVEFEPVVSPNPTLQAVSQGVFELVPPVLGI